MAIVIAPAMTDRMKPMPPTDMLPTLSLSLSQYHFERLSDLPRHLPGLLDCPARELHHHLTGPTLLHLPGRRQPELFVSVLLHGNEDVGWVAVQQLLREALAHRQDRLPRALTVLIGNVQAARQGLRRLDGQPDHNRVWPGAVEYLGSPEQLLMAEVHRLQCERGLFAAIDLHNNTGLNPHYGIVCRSTPAHLHLARLFSRTVVLFRGLPGTQTAAFTPLCPAVAVECGKPGVAANEAEAARFLAAALHLSEFPDHGLQEGDLDLYHTLARVKVREEVRFDFAPPEGIQEDIAPLPPGCDLWLDARLDRLNFRELAAGRRFGRSRHPMPLRAEDEAGADITARCFQVREGELRLSRAAMPAMLTLDARVVRQDCLCYLMERLPMPRGRDPAATRSTASESEPESESASTQAC